MNGLCRASEEAPSLVWEVHMSQASPPGDNWGEGTGEGASRGGSSSQQWPRVMIQTDSVVCDGPGVLLEKRE